MYAFFLSRVSLHNTGTQSYLRSLHYPFTRARCRVRSAWLLGSSTRQGRTSQKPTLRANSSAQGHTRLSLCGSGATIRAGACSSRRTTTRTLGVWRHGDFIAMNPRTKGLIILGRRFAPSSFPRLSLLACAEVLMLVYQ